MDIMCPIASTEDRGFDIRSRQTIYYEAGIFCFSAKHATVMQRVGVSGIDIMCPT